MSHSAASSQLIAFWRRRASRCESVCSCQKGEDERKKGVASALERDAGSRLIFHAAIIRELSGGRSRVRLACAGWKPITAISANLQLVLIKRVAIISIAFILETHAARILRYLLLRIRMVRGLSSC